MKVYKKDGLYIPIRHIDDDLRAKIENRFTHTFYKKETVCEACDFYSERPSDACEGCGNFGGVVSLASERVVNDKQYMRLPFGYQGKLHKLIGDHKLVDKTPEVPMRRPIKFLGKLRDNQVNAAKAMREFGFGVLRSPPRSGKTVLGTHFVCHTGLKTLVLAAQKDWLDNFHETFVGSEKEQAMTDGKPKRIGFAKTLEDFERLDVAFVTYQLFLSEKGKKLLRKIRNKFSVLLVDEIQTAGATELASVISQLNCRYKIGVSGTPERKDQKEKLIYQLLGPIFFDNKVERLRPEIQAVWTSVRGKLPQSWTYMVSALEKNPERLKLIAKTAIADAKAGHMVLIPLTRVAVIRALTEAINRLADREIAASFYGGGKKEERKRTIDRARAYKIKIIVGNTRLLSTGINIPRASMLYQCSPSSNLPRADQKFSRILTPHEGKPRPVVKYFLDDVDVIRNCMRAEHWGCLMPTFRPIISKDTMAMLTEYFGNKKRRHQHTGGMI